MFGRGGKARIGFDWSGETLKAVRVVWDVNTPRITHCVLDEAKGLALAVARMRAAGIRPGRGSFHASIPDDGVRVRELDLEGVPEAEIAAALPAAMTRETGPAAEGGWVIDHQTLRRDERGGRVTVLAAAAPRMEITAYRDSLERAGAGPDRLEPAGIAACNHWMRQSGAGSAGPGRALLDIGAAASRITFLHEGYPLRTRRIEVGGEDFTAEIRERCGISRDEAERVKRAETPLGAIRPDRGDRAAPIADLIRVSMDRLAGEVRAHRAAFHGRGGLLGGLTLAGGGALLLGIDRALSLRLDLPVEVIDPFEPFALPEDWSGEKEDRITGEAPRFLTALGLTRWWER
ncbi:MAG: pilus assembly protein PilM [Candidatus Eisenbacteria bacterium]|nr:pilus assembly protein PilM [Candidatus Eisenbacteria bacterium]